MNEHIKWGLKGVSELGKKAIKTAVEANQATAESSLRAAKFLAHKGKGSAMQASQSLSHSASAGNVAKTARVVISAGPVKEMAKICGRAGFAGAVVDGAMGGMHAAKFLHEGKITSKEAAIHVGAEAGCGFVTSTSGTAGTLIAYMVTGSMGPAVLVAGMGASLGSRYVYRQFVGETLPKEGKETSQTDDEPGKMEDIGPKPQI